MADTVQHIKDRLSIVDVVSQYVKLERSGANLRARCPFHAERSPSFFVSPDRGTYHCFGCNVGGDIFSFIEAIEGLDFKGALKVLAEKAGVTIEYTKGGKEEKGDREKLFELLEVATIFYASRLSDAALTYLKERGIDEKTVHTFRVGLAGKEWSDASDFLKSKKYTEREILDTGLVKKTERGSLVDKFRNRIMFPIADSAGRIVGFSGRIFGEDASPDAPKYLNSPETLLFHKSRILYGFDKAKQTMRRHNCAVLVEGQLDLLASTQAGWGNTVAVSGTAFTPEHAGLIKRMTENIVIALDADTAGIKAAGRAARAALQSGLNVKVVTLPAELDPADLILKEGKEAWSKAIREAKDIITFLLDVLEKHAKDNNAFRRSVESIVLPFLSDVTSPIAREQYVREIATRLKVSEHAVAEALGKQPSPLRWEGRPKGPGQEPPPLTQSYERAKQAYAIVLWQKSLPKSAFDIKAYETELEASIGPEAYEKVKALPETDHEKMRFAAERLHGKSKTVAVEAEALLSVIQKEQLARELARATMALQQAEMAGDDKEIEVRMAVCNVLTTKIAQLHQVR